MIHGDNKKNPILFDYTYGVRRWLSSEMYFFHQCLLHWKKHEQTCKGNFHVHSQKGKQSI